MSIPIYRVAGNFLDATVYQKRYSCQRLYLLPGTVNKEENIDRRSQFLHFINVNFFDFYKVL